MPWALNTEHIGVIFCFFLSEHIGIIFCFFLSGLDWEQLINYYEYILSIYTAWGYAEYGDKKMNKIQSLLSKFIFAG